MIMGHKLPLEMTWNVFWVLKVCQIKRQWCWQTLLELLSLAVVGVLEI